MGTDLGNRNARPPAQPAVGSTSLLPTVHGCLDRRKFTFKLHHAPTTKVVKVVAFVNLDMEGCCGGLAASDENFSLHDRMKAAAEGQDFVNCSE